MLDQEFKNRVAALAVTYGIVGTNFSQPITFRSGIKSPIYCDWRKSQEHDDLMDLIELGFSKLMIEKGFDNKTCVIAGVQTGGVPHAAQLRKGLRAVSCYVRPGASSKTYGLGKAVEGASVKGKRVFLIEDLVTTGGSVIENVNILKQEGATEVIPFCIFTYGFSWAYQEFEAAGLSLTSIITVSDVLPLLKEKLSPQTYDLLASWIEHPKEWFDQHKVQFDFGYLTKLRKAVYNTDNLLCLGWDLIPEALPEEFDQGPRGCVQFSREYFDLLRSHGYSPAAFKPNQGFYTRFDMGHLKHFEGSESLGEIINLFTELFPDIPIILDAKRGDIGPSSENYAQDFSNWGVDAVTISGFMGEDSVAPFTRFCNKDTERGVYILARTSNPGAKDIQAQQTMSGQPVYGVMGDKIIEWANKKPGVGAVVGATSLPELASLAKKFTGKDICWLIPGVGKQGGSGKEVIATLKNNGIELDIVRINSSSALTHPWFKKENQQRGPGTWKDICLKAYEDTLKEIAY